MARCCLAARTRKSASRLVARRTYGSDWVRSDSIRLSSRGIPLAVAIAMWNASWRANQSSVGSTVEDLLDQEFQLLSLLRCHAGGCPAGREGLQLLRMS